MRYAPYLQGHLAGAGEALSSASAASDALSGHWFEPYYAQMAAVMETLWGRLGQWADLVEFEPLCDIADDLLGEGGIIITRLGGDEVYVDVPFSPATLPSPDEEARFLSELKPT